MRLRRQYEVQGNNRSLTTVLYKSLTPYAIFRLRILIKNYIEVKLTYNNKTLKANDINVYIYILKNNYYDSITNISNHEAF